MRAIAVISESRKWDKAFKASKAHALSRLRKSK